METAPPSGSDDLLPLVHSAAAGDGTSWQKLVQLCHDRLRRMVALRIDPRLQGRVDPSDVLQDVYLNASKRIADYLAEPRLPFYLWLRCLTGDQLGRVHRFHLGTQARDVAREVPLGRMFVQEATSTALAAQLVANMPTPSEQADRAEQMALLQEALACLDPLDREVLALRHFEQLSSPEVAQVLEITPSAAAKRYFRALQRLRGLFAQRLGGLDGFLP